MPVVNENQAGQIGSGDTDQCMPVTRKTDVFTVPKRVLAVANAGIDQTELFAKLAALRARFGCEINLLAFRGARPGSSAPLGDARVIEDHLRLCAMSYFTEGDGLTIDVRNLIDKNHSLSESVIRYVDENAIDLVVKTGHRSEDIFHCPEDWYLNRHMNCNMMILPERQWRPKKHILLAVDIESDRPSQKALNERLFAWAARLKGDSHQLTVMTTIEIHDALATLDMLAPSRRIRQQGQPLKDRMREALSKHGLDDADVVVSAGDPARKILSNANRLQAETVLVGSAARNGIERIFNGNTAEQVMHHLRTALFVIKR